MNIVEAYIKFNKQLIIAISGISGCGRINLSKDIERDFNLKLIDLYDFYDLDHEETVQIKDKTIINWYKQEAFNWDKFNEYVNKNKNKGIVLVGLCFPDDKIDFNIDSHIFVGRDKKECLEKRQEFIKRNKETYKYEYNNLDFEKTKFNKLEFPFVLEMQKKSKIDKFVNATELTSSQVYDSIYEYLIVLIQKKLK